MYCTAHDVKVTFCMLEFYSSKIISYRFHIDKNEGESGISYYMIIVHDLMVKLGLPVDCKRQGIQWYDVTVPMEKQAVC